MRVMRICTILLISGALTIASGYWEPTGPEGGPATFILQSLTDSDTFYSFTGTTIPFGVFKSTDEGDNWTATGSFDTQIYSTAIGPTGLLFVGSMGNIYVSDDEGATWDGYPLTGFYAYKMATHPTNPNLVYSAGFESVSGSYYITLAVSTNGGSSWTLNRVTTEQGYGRCISVSNSSPNILYVGGSTRNPVEPILFRSTDGGTSFTEITNSAWSGDNILSSVTIHPTNSNTLCAGTTSCIYRTTNGGGSWSTVSSSTAYHYAMQYSRANPSVVIAGGKDCFYRSLNGGLSWTTHTEGLNGGSVMSLAADWSTSSRLHTVNYTGIYRTDNTGTSWYGTNGGLYMGKVLSFLAVETSPWTLYASLTNLGLFRTTNNAVSWIPLGTPLACGDVCAMATEEGNPNRLLALEGVG